MKPAKGVLPFIPGAAALRQLGYETSAFAPPSSTSSFPDGGLWRVEIPSVEGPKALEAVLEESESLEVPIHRVSQGSGVTMLTDVEIRDMVLMCEERGIELCLFARPGANWDIGAARDAAGGLSGRARGLSQLSAAIAEIQRASDLGVKSLLVSDEGLLVSAHQLRVSGLLPPGIQFKTSVMAAPLNPAAVVVHGLLGADTVNVPSDMSLQQLREIREACDTTLDFYIEAPDNIGGFVRHHEIYEIIRVASPVYVKFGLRNAPDVYPSGAHLQSLVVETCRERVRRARLGLDLLDRAPFQLPMSPQGSRLQHQPRRLKLED